VIASPRILVLAASIAVLLAASPARAQWLDLGAKGGVDLATQQITGTGSATTPRPRIGLVAGVFGTGPLVSWLDVQVEALFAMRGTKVTVGSVTTSEEIDYLDVPVLARVKKGLGSGKVYAAGGPSAAFKLRARTRTSFSGSTEEIDIGNQVETLDLGVSMGGGVERGRLTIDARYTLGISNIDKDKTDGTKTTNRTLAVTVGYRFHP
jgi:ABC-type amino acid transport substrate-binding protein